MLFTLVQKNLEDLRRDIPIRQLPKTFQDAIYVTFELGISYIWIDSLCIIQDSKEDWTHEAKRMGDVYLHGEFNISATAYKDGSSGLFSERKALSLKHFPLYVDFVLVQKGENLIAKGHYKGYYILWDYSEFHDKVENGILFSRAWVAQERALSPALLHYTREQIWWECNESIWSEAVPEDTPSTQEKLIWEEAEGSGKDRIRSLSKQSEPEQVYTFWRTFLAQHSGDLLTFQSDRFPAVAGLARILGDIIDDNLIAGFWSGDLVRSLAMVRGPPRQAIQPNLIAPTWSWASICSTTFFTGKHECNIEPLPGVEVIRVLSDVPGFTSDLHSTHFEKSAVRGLVVRGVLRRLPDWFESHLNAAEWIHDPTLPIILSDVDATSDHLNPWRWGKENIPEEQKWRLKRPTHMLLLVEGRRTEGIPYFARGLLVQAAENGEPNTFRRTGTIDLDTGEDFPEWDKCFGLRGRSEGEPGGVWSEEQGLQDVILI